VEVAEEEVVLLVYGLILAIFVVLMGNQALIIASLPREVQVGVLALLNITIQPVGKVLAMLDLCLLLRIHASVMKSILVAEIVALLVIGTYKDHVPPGLAG